MVSGAALQRGTVAGSAGVNNFQEAFNLQREDVSEADSLPGLWVLAEQRWQRIASPGTATSCSRSGAKVRNSISVGVFTAPRFVGNLSEFKASPAPLNYTQIWSWFNNCVGGVG